MSDELPQELEAKAREFALTWMHWSSEPPPALLRMVRDAMLYAFTRAEEMSDEQDAARYRFLRDQCDLSWTHNPSQQNKLPAPMIDAAIDAIRNSTPAPVGAKSGERIE